MNYKFYGNFNDNWGKINMRQNAANFLVISMIVLALCLVTPAQAVDHLGIFELDGNATDDDNNFTLAPDDWETLYYDQTGSPSKFISSVFINDSKSIDDSYFGETTKDITDLDAWNLGNSAPDKGEIQNAYSAAYNENGNLILYFGLDRSAAYNENGNLILYFGLDRFDASGDVAAGFWFFQNPISINHVDDSFNGVHAEGDILVVAGFTKGGTVDTVDVYSWNISETNNLDAEVCGIVNNDTTISSPWPFIDKDGNTGNISELLFFEGTLNVSYFFPEDVVCFSSFLAESRSSQEPTAKLKDFAIGSFFLCDARINITPPTDTNEVGDPHVLTATAEYKTGTTPGWVNATDETLINFSIMSGPGDLDPDNCTTSGSTGNCSVNLNSTTSGITLVNASADIKIPGSSVIFHRVTDGTGENSEPAQKTWVNATISIEPDDTNEVGDPHTFTIHIEKDNGTGWVDAVGETPTITFPDGMPEYVDDSNCSDGTDANGNCTVVINSTVAGVYTVHANATISVDAMKPTAVTPSRPTSMPISLSKQRKRTL